MLEEQLDCDLERVELEPHGSSRSRALAKTHMSAGSLILSCEASTTVLLPEEKGRRCDACHMRSSVLQKCSVCASYFYCGPTCQVVQWQSHHKRICKRFNKYTSSLAFQALAPHEKLDAVLLSHLVAQLDGSLDSPSQSTRGIMSLLPGPVEPPLPPIVYTSTRVAERVMREMYSRFGNNNFVIHSHLNTFGHGIFPLASRLFNHSCLPNAAAKYILLPSHPPKLEVVALRDIAPDEEICLPYLDPALVQPRQQIFDLTYGFKCSCHSCLFFEKMGAIPGPPSDAAERDNLARKLIQFIATTPCDALTLQSAQFPPALLSVFHESFISSLAETFRNASHDGSYALALDSGDVLLALYRLIYPPNYPQIGMHLLELAKTCWNSVVAQETDAVSERRKREKVWGYLTEAKAVLQILGPEGDEDGPLVEINTLENLLQGD
ncbi:hypothetical protein B0H10DRAFT_241912 [Mycena sp. CBHHK59/15]|nr:hypothetical protein B0H10DRAFT_241912 [Mycena sp. CBHHK59/15]